MAMKVREVSNLRQAGDIKLGVQMTADIIDQSC